MKSIQKQIRQLFKKITIIDYLLLAIFVCGAAIFLIFFRRQNSTIVARFKVTDKDVLYAQTKPFAEFADNFMVGDVEKNEVSKTTSEIVNVDIYNVTADHKVVYLDIKLDTVYNPRTQQYSIKGRPLIFGQPFTFSFTKVHFDALVVDFPGSGKNHQTETTVVKAQMRHDSRTFSDVYGVPNYLATAIKVGDTVTDSNQHVMAKILDIKISPAKRTFITNAGQIIQGNDPELKDVFYTVALQTKTIGDKKYMFDYIPVVIDGVLPLNFPSASVFPKITEIVQ